MCVWGGVAYIQCNLIQVSTLEKTAANVLALLLYVVCCTVEAGFMGNVCVRVCARACDLFVRVRT